MRFRLWFVPAALGWMAWLSATVPFVVTGHAGSGLWIGLGIANVLFVSTPLVGIATDFE